MTYEVKKAKEIIKNYNELVERAIKVAQNAPFNTWIENEESVKISIEERKLDKEITLKLTWTYYESDYYGGGNITTENAYFPVNLLFETDEEFNLRIKKIKTEKLEQEKKLKKAQDAVARQRKEEHDRKEYERLKKKYS